MSPLGFRAVPRRHSPAILTLDSGTTGGQSPRFLTLLVQCYREWEHPRTDEPTRYSVELPPV